ncbi:hypothetical protein [Streptomyces sp. WAC 01529]|uniref:hypothetical protein n=1 Tax=Streptomyces sp. WAC 01529 TaxID=2203205 RepID=UPI0026CA7194
MTRGPYVAVVFAGDETRAVCLGGSFAVTRRLALRWLRAQALRFADALDPSPCAEWLPPGALQPVTQRAPDAPADLRGWARDAERQGDALRQLAAGCAYEFRTRDDDCWYVLTARPVAAPSPPFPREEGTPQAPVRLLRLSKERQPDGTTSRHPPRSNSTVTGSDERRGGADRASPRRST